MQTIKKMREGNKIFGSFFKNIYVLIFFVSLLHIFYTKRIKFAKNYDGVSKLEILF